MATAPAANRSQSAPIAGAALHRQGPLPSEARQKSDSGKGSRTRDPASPFAIQALALGGRRGGGGRPPGRLRASFGELAVRRPAGFGQPPSAGPEKVGEKRQAG